MASAGYPFDPAEITEKRKRIKRELLADGTLVVVSGRPGIYMLVDFTGTGRKYQKIDIFKAPDRYQSSSTCSIPRIADDTVLLLYDISSFSTYQDQRKINHIFSMPITFKKATQK